MSCFSGKEEIFATVKISLTHSSVDEILQIVIGMIQSVVIFMLAWFGYNQHHLSNDHHQNNLINARHVD